MTKETLPQHEKALQAAWERVLDSMPVQGERLAAEYGYLAAQNCLADPDLTATNDISGENILLLIEDLLLSEAVSPGVVQDFLARIQENYQKAALPTGRAIRDAEKAIREMMSQKGG